MASQVCSPHPEKDAGEREHVDVLCLSWKECYLFTTRLFHLLAAWP